MARPKVVLRQAAVTAEIVAEVLASFTEEFNAFHLKIVQDSVALERTYGRLQYKLSDKGVAYDALIKAIDARLVLLEALPEPVVEEEEVVVEEEEEEVGGDNEEIRI